MSQLSVSLAMGWGGVARVGVLSGPDFKRALVSMGTWSIGYNNICKRFESKGWYEVGQET